MIKELINQNFNRESIENEKNGVQLLISLLTIIIKKFFYF